MKRHAWKPLPETTEPTADNLRAVIEIERQTQQERSKVQVLTDRVTAAASSFPFVAFHLCWFSIWIAANTLSSHRFDPFPFNLLTMIVSLEAILLTAVVLMSQNHMTLLADRRAHLDLQVNLLAERELTAILKAVSLISEKVGVDVHQCDNNLDEYARPDRCQGVVRSSDRGTDGNKLKSQPGSIMSGKARATRGVKRRGGGMAERATRERIRPGTSDQTSANTASAESRLNAYAEAIGAAMGNVRNHIDDWNGQRAHLVEQLSSLVSDAQTLLADLGHTATEQVKKVRRSRKRKTFAAPDANPAGGMKHERRPKKDKMSGAGGEAVSASRTARSAKSRPPAPKRARPPQSPRS